MAFFWLLLPHTTTRGEAYNPTNHLSVGDVVVDNTTHPSLIQIKLKQSKTDHAVWERPVLWSTLAARTQIYASFPQFLHLWHLEEIV